MSDTEPLEGLETESHKVCIGQRGGANKERGKTDETIPYNTVHIVQYSFLVISFFDGLISRAA